MKRNRSAVFVAIAAAVVSLNLIPTQRAHAQDRTPDLNSLRPSSAPALILLGAAPSSVERPGTPADFGLLIVNRTKGLTSLPEDFAAEVAPYWLRPRPRLTWQDDATRDPLQSLLRTLTFSAASAEIGSEDASSTGVAVGARFQLLSGQLSAAARDTLAALEASLAAEGAMFQRFLQPQRQTLDTMLASRLRAVEANFPAVSDSALRRMARTIIVEQYEAAKLRLIGEVTADPAFQDSLAEGRKRFENIALDRVGPLLEIAGGAGWAFPEAVWEDGSFDRLGVWALAGWAGGVALADGPRLTPLLLVRYVAQRSDTLPDFVDAGARLIVADDRYGASVELVLRRATGDDRDEESNLYRITGNLEYQLRRDAWALLTFGRDHDSTREGSLIALLGVRVQFAGERYRR